MNHLIRIILVFLITWQSALATSYGVNLGAGGEGGGAPGYTNVGSFPVTASDGDQAVDLSTGSLYVYTSGSWQLIGSPTVIAAIGALNGQAKNANAGAVSGNTIYMQSADATWPGVLTAADWSTFNSKEPAISAGTALQYWRGDKTFQTLDTAAVPENTNLYFTDARARTAAVADAINNGTTNIAPSQNAVFDALALKIDLTEKGANNGVATLDAGGKIPVAQLPNTVMEYQGAWNANTNTPALADGVGSTGDVYLVSVAGTQNLGSGAITFAAGDWAVYNGATWEKTINSNAVVSVNGQQGVVSLDTDDISEGATNLYYLDSRARAALSVSAPLGYNSGTGAFTITQAGAAQDGYLSSTDWNTFNNKQAAGNYITALTGDVSATGPGSVAATIGANVVSNSKLAQMAAGTIKGNNTGGLSDPLDLTTAQVTAMLNQFTALLQGLVPASGGGTTNFLRADGTWAAPAGAGDVVGPASATDDAIVRYDGTTGKLIQNSGATLSDAGVITASGFVGPLTGNASTATALAANPTDCGAGTKATAIDANGNLTCSAVSLTADVSGTLPAANGGYGTDIQEAAAGTINNSNTAFTLSQTPVSAASVALYKNGRLLIQGTDYTITGVNITMTVAPNFAEVLRAVYRY